jgi:hypothetical protein
MEAETSKTELARALLDAKMTTNEFSEYASTHTEAFDFDTIV